MWDASCLLEKQVRRAVSQFLREVAFLTWFFLARRCVLVVSSLRYVFLITVLAGFPLAAKNAGVSGEWSIKLANPNFQMLGINVAFESIEGFFKTRWTAKRRYFLWASAVSAFTNETPLNESQ